MVRSAPDARIAIKGVSCRRQIQDGTGRRPEHVVEVFRGRWSWGRQPADPGVRIPDSPARCTPVAGPRHAGTPGQRPSPTREDRPGWPTPSGHREPVLPRRGTPGMWSSEPFPVSRAAHLPVGSMQGDRGTAAVLRSRLHLSYDSDTTGLRSVPIPGISISTTSPAWSASTPPGAPVRMMSPG